MLCHELVTSPGYTPPITRRPLLSFTHTSPSNITHVAVLQLLVLLAPGSEIRDSRAIHAHFSQTFHENIEVKYSNQTSILVPKTTKVDIEIHLAGNCKWSNLCISKLILFHVTLSGNRVYIQYTGVRQNIGHTHPLLVLCEDLRGHNIFSRH